MQQQQKMQYQNSVQPSDLRTDPKNDKNIQLHTVQIYTDQPTQFQGIMNKQKINHYQIDLQVLRICCRICLQHEPEKDLRSPCKCRGSSQYVHGKCLTQWINANENQKPKLNENNNTYQFTCEICQHKIALELRECGQVKKSILLDKCKFGLEVLGILALILTQAFLCIKYQDFRKQGNFIFTSLSLILLIVIAISIIGITLSLLYGYFVQAYDQYTICHDFIAENDPQSALSLQKQNHPN